MSRANPSSLIDGENRRIGKTVDGTLVQGFLGDWGRCNRIHQTPEPRAT